MGTASITTTVMDTTAMDIASTETVLDTEAISIMDSYGLFMVSSIHFLNSGKQTDSDESYSTLSRVAVPV